MKSREEVVKFITEHQLKDMSGKRFPDKPAYLGYGRCELRELMDFIYGSPPAHDKELIRTAWDMSQLLGETK